MIKKSIPDRLNKRVTIQSKTASNSRTPSDVWKDEFSTWGEVKTLFGRELEVAVQIHAETTVEVNIRYAASRTVTQGERVKYKTRYFNILAVLNVNEANKELKLLCKEVIE